MIEGRPSQTALHVAAARAAHLRYDPPPHLLRDEAAADLLGAEAEALIGTYDDQGTQLLIENRIFIPLRARYAEDCLAEARKRGVQQFVVLGAGLDAFGFRQPPGPESLEIYEVDHPSTQTWKLDRLHALGWDLPRNLHFVPCDFERRSVSEVLLEAGFDRTRPSVVSWLGVVYYLEPETVAASLRDLHSIQPHGSQVVLDYMRPWEELSPRYDDLRAAVAQYLEKAGEPQVNRTTRGDLERVVLDAGYSDVEIESRASIEARYIAPLATSIPLSERFGLAVALR